MIVCNVVYVRYVRKNLGLLMVIFVVRSESNR